VKEPSPFIRAVGIAAMGGNVMAGLFTGNYILAAIWAFALGMSLWSLHGRQFQK